MQGFEHQGPAQDAFLPLVNVGLCPDRQISFSGSLAFPKASPASSAPLALPGGGPLEEFLLDFLTQFPQALDAGGLEWKSFRSPSSGSLTGSDSRGGVRASVFGPLISSGGGLEATLTSSAVFLAMLRRMPSPGPLPTPWGLPPPPAIDEVVHGNGFVILGQAQRAQKKPAKKKAGQNETVKQNGTGAGKGEFMVRREMPP